MQAFRAGNLVESERNAVAVLEIAPKSADALHLLGVIRGIQSRHEEAEQFLRKAVEVEKKNNFIFFNLAKSLSAQGKDRDSIKWHKKALELDPKHTMAWLNYGKSLFNLGDIDGALAAYDRALSLNGNLAEAYTNKAVCLRSKKAYDGALSLHDIAIRLGPDIPELWRNRGTALCDLNRHEEAIADYARAIELDSQNAESWNNLGAVLNKLNRHEEAINCYARALEINPTYATALNNRGVALKDLKRHHEALASYAQAIEIRPDFADAWSNRGLTYTEIDRPREALESFERAIHLKPDHAEARYNRGLLELRQHNYKSGFEDYLSRWMIKDFPSEIPRSEIPACKPGQIRGRVLLWGEQGLGDEIFYCGLLPEALRSEAEIALSADSRLHPILKRSFPRLTLIDRADTASALSSAGYDSQAPMGDLGYLLKLDKEAIRSTRTPHLLANPERKLQFKRDQFSLYEGAVCGLSWRSNNRKFGKEKSIELASLSSLLKTSDLSFVNLQYGEVTEEIDLIKSQYGADIHKISHIDLFNDIDGLLALIDACDFVLTTSNVTAHLAGSIGKPGCVLVPYGKGRFWYWHHDDDFSFWYPSLKIFYQDNPHDWSNTINQATEWIRDQFDGAHQTSRGL